MTTKKMKARREAFEAEYLKLDRQASEHLAFMRDDGEYGYSATRVAWACYNAALDSLCVTLPERKTRPAGWAFEPMNNEGFNECLDLAVEAIHAAGVKTR